MILKALVRSVLTALICDDFEEAVGGIGGSTMSVIVNCASGYFSSSTGIISWPMKPDAPVISIFMTNTRINV